MNEDTSQREKSITVKYMYIRLFFSDNEWRVEALNLKNGDMPHTCNSVRYEPAEECYNWLITKYSKKE